jgi:hypothetical protein
MVDLANAALQAAAAQNVNTTALTFIGAQLTRPDIGELTRRAQAIRGSSLDLKLPDRMLSPVEGSLRQGTSLRYRRQRGAPTAESKDRTTARMFFRSSKATAAWPWRANGKLSPNRGHGHMLPLLTIFGIVIGETRQKQVF